MAAAALRALALLATATLLIQSARSASFKVGGSTGGWDLNTNLNGWASAQTFTSGDTLTFNYDSMHSVVEVTKPNYDACQINNPIGTFTGGNTVITLKSPGKRYFTCGTAGHCSSGMKLEIDTVAAAVATPPPVAPVTPSTPPPTPPPQRPKPPPAKTPSPPPKAQSPEASRAFARSLLVLHLRHLHQARHLHWHLLRHRWPRLRFVAAALGTATFGG
ncbi:hypothetical protein J5N97_011651 [Dioscorea zingiberensis]|uniref:Phytocyanin domain-containing protein n=1 Tax=Dioscorea zingiberensis TaxID=325984 RepID=A0A9D5D1F6_9LILI|nr:hypothetical protein J5N97_011651 [Dioscorea zingiberensis]